MSLVDGDEGEMLTLAMLGAVLSMVMLAVMGVPSELPSLGVTVHTYPRWVSLNGACSFHLWGL